MLFKIASDYREAILIKRENRFTLLLEKNKSIIRAFLPNTGRLEEFMIPGRKFYVSAKTGGKLQYRCISTLYKNRFILLDTHKVQKIFKKLIENEMIHLKDLKAKCSSLRVLEEYSIGAHRIDLAIKYTEENGNSGLSLIEVKSCTLCHNGTGMFPDAPSKRAIRHVKVLGDLNRKGIKTYILFLIPDPSARVFIPNIHTDPDFSKELFSREAPTTLAYRIILSDPVTVDLSSLKEIKINIEPIKNLKSGGSYILVMENRTPKTLEVGSLGNINFKTGYYVYVGSALNNLERRINRHMRKIKPRRWHIDYIVPEHLKIIKVYKIRRKEKLEEIIVEELGPLSSDQVKGFGAGDSKHSSHLLYFKSPPHLNQEFIERVLDFMTFTEKK